MLLQCRLTVWGSQLSRDTLSLGADCVRFFPLFEGQRRQYPVCCPDCISLCRCRKQAKVPGTISLGSLLSGADTASTAARDQWVCERGGARGRDKTRTGHAGLGDVSWPNNRVQATGNSLRSYVAPAISSA